MTVENYQNFGGVICMCDIGYYVRQYEHYVNVFDKVLTKAESIELDIERLKNSSNGYNMKHWKYYIAIAESERVYKILDQLHNAIKRLDAFIESYYDIQYIRENIQPKALYTTQNVLDRMDFTDMVIRQFNLTHNKQNPNMIGGNKHAT